MIVHREAAVTKVSPTPEETLILLRPGGMLAGLDLGAGVDVLFGDEGGLFMISRDAAKRIVKCDPTHLAEAALIRLL